jgi:hypothetical protein
LREVVPLGEQLRANEDVGVAPADVFERLRERRAPPRDVAVDPYDPRRGKEAGDRFLDPLGAAADRTQVGIPAGWAEARHRVLRAAMVAAQAPIRGVQHESRRAARAARGPAAGLAGEHRRVAAPVDEEKALLAERQAVANGFDRRIRKAVLNRLRAQIDGVNVRKARAWHGAFRQLDLLVAAGERVLPALERRRGGAEDHRAARALGESDRCVACGIAQPLLLLERGVVLFVDDHETEARHGPEHREPRAEHDPGIAGCCRQPRRSPRDLFQPAMHHDNASLRECAADPPFQLRSQADLGNQHQRLCPSFEHARNQLQVDLGLPAACHTMQQESAKRSEGAADFLHRVRLRRGRQMRWYETRSRRRGSNGGTDFFSATVAASAAAGVARRRRSHRMAADSSQQEIA